VALFRIANERVLLTIVFQAIMGLMTTRMLEKEVMELPPQTRVRLAEKIIESIDGFGDAKIASQWDEEISRRVKDIRSGAEKSIPAEEVMKTARREVNEARRLSSPRRK
jgi:putative addiction module component (TIGR02574 family)